MRRFRIFNQIYVFSANFITTAGSLVRRTFFCFFSYNSNKSPSGGKRKTRTKFEFRDDIYARLPPMNDSWLASGELLATGARDSRCGSHSLGRTTAPAQGARGPQALRLLVATGSLLPRDQPARSSRSCGPHGQMCWQGSLREAAGFCPSPAP